MILHELYLQFKLRQYVSRKKLAGEIMNILYAHSISADGHWMFVDVLERLVCKNRNDFAGRRYKKIPKEKRLAILRPSEEQIAQAIGLLVISGSIESMGLRPRGGKRGVASIRLSDWEFDSLWQGRNPLPEPIVRGHLRLVP